MHILGKSIVFQSKHAVHLVTDIMESQQSEELVLETEPPYVPEDYWDEDYEAIINGEKMFLICVAGQEDKLFYADRGGKVYGEHGHQYGNCSN